MSTIKNINGYEVTPKVNAAQGLGIDENGAAGVKLGAGLSFDSSGAVTAEAAETSVAVIATAINAEAARWKMPLYQGGIDANGNNFGSEDDGYNYRVRTNKFFARNTTVATNDTYYINCVYFYDENFSFMGYANPNVRELNDLDLAGGSYPIYDSTGADITLDFNHVAAVYVRFSFLRSTDNFASTTPIDYQADILASVGTASYHRLYYNLLTRPLHALLLGKGFTFDETSGEYDLQGFRVTYDEAVEAYNNIVYTTGNTVNNNTLLYTRDLGGKIVIWQSYVPCQTANVWSLNTLFGGNDDLQLLHIIVKSANSLTVNGQKYGYIYCSNLYGLATQSQGVHNLRKITGAVFCLYTTAVLTASLLNVASLRANLTNGADTCEVYIILGSNVVTNKDAEKYPLIGYNWTYDCFNKLVNNSLHATDVYIRINNNIFDFLAALADGTNTMEMYNGTEAAAWETLIDKDVLADYESTGIPSVANANGGRVIFVRFTES